MDFIEQSQSIAGVQIARLTAYADERGAFMEVFRKEWFPQVSWERLQSNRSNSKAGVLRGLHYHFRQVDYWYVPHGRIRAALLDLRPKSPTHRATQVIEMGEENNIGLFIPIGVAHGFYALTECTLMYFVNNYYDSSDEFGVAWDDPDIAMPWGAGQPLLSERDANNPRLSDLPPEAVPTAAP